MAGEITPSDLNGLFKDVFHKDVEDLIPEHALLAPDKGLISMVPSDKTLGELYSVPTVLRRNQGVSYLGEAGAVATLKDPKPGVMKEAQVKGSEINVRGQISYKALSQAAAKGSNAFKKSSAWLVQDLQEVAFTRLEIAALHGRNGLGTVESISDLGSGSMNIVITEATFAAGMWPQLEGATIDAFTGTTKNNASGVLTITLVTTSTRTIKVTYTGTAADEVDPGDVLYFEGANAGGGSFNEIVGLIKQFTDTSSTLFNLDRSAYSLLQGNTKSSVGAISKAKVVDAAMLAVDKGAMGELICLVSTKAWAVLQAEDMALRRFDSSYSKGKSQSGSKEIGYEAGHCSVKVVCHPLMKNGEALIFKPDDVIWVGSSKPTFEVPGFEKEFFRFVQDKNAVELQNYSDLAIYALKPSQGVVMTGITYS